MDGGGQNGIEGGRRRRVEIVGDGLVGGVEWYGEECGKRGQGSGKVCGKAVQSSARSGWRRHREAPARRSLAWDFEFLSAKTEN